MKDNRLARSIGLFVQECEARGLSAPYAAAIRQTMNKFRDFALAQGVRAPTKVGHGSVVITQQYLAASADDTRKAMEAYILV